MVVPALRFSLGKEDELDDLNKIFRGNTKDFISTVIDKSVTSQMRIAMAMIQTVLHLVTSVSSSTYGTNNANSTI